MHPPAPVDFESAYRELKAIAQRELSRHGQRRRTVELNRGWLASIGNWVLMTAEEQALGLFPGVSQVSTLGYVYPAVSYGANGPQFLDDDADTLPDAFETLIGLSAKKADSDGDGRADGAELPFAAPGVSDPAINDAVVPCVP